MQILERFEIALRLDDERILVPSMLPKERPIFNMKFSQRVHKMNPSTRRQLIENDSNSKDGESPFSRINYILRNYHLSYIPAGFWSRLVGKYMSVFLH